MDRRSWANRVTLLAIWPATAAVVSCMAPGTNWLNLSMSTNASEYESPAYPIQVPVQFQNKADRDATLHGCTDVPCAKIEQWNGYAWIEACSINCFCPALFVPKHTVVPPGEVLQFTVPIATDGRFRVRVPVDIGNGDEVRVYSNEFLVGGAQARR